MNDYRVDFEQIEWRSPMDGVRHKVVTNGGRKLRLVEYAPSMPPHWCEKGHLGYILAGVFEIEFDDGIRTFEEGDGVFIPDGAAHRHRAKALTETVTAIFVEDA